MGTWSPTPARTRRNQPKITVTVHNPESLAGGWVALGAPQSVTVSATALQVLGSIRRQLLCGCIVERLLLPNFRCAFVFCQTR